MVPLLIIIAKGFLSDMIGLAVVFFALLEDVYSQQDTGRRNVATYYYMSRGRANTIFQKLVSDSKKSPIIPIRNFKEKDYVAYGGEIFL